MRRFRILAIGLAMLLTGSVFAMAQERDWDHDRDRARGEERGRWENRERREAREQQERREHERDWRWRQGQNGYAYPGYGQYPAYPNNRYPSYGNGSVYRNGYPAYGNNYPYGGRNGMQVAQQYGYQDGLAEGSNDRAQGHSFRPTHDRGYQLATNGYQGAYGSRDQYKAAYRQAYQQGYAQGYNSGGYGYGYPPY